MTANLKAPIVINILEKTAKQVVLQENDQPIKHPMFKELRAHLISQAGSTQARQTNKQVQAALEVKVLPVHSRVELI
jgi:hypothetical protein